MERPLRVPEQENDDGACWACLKHNRACDRALPWCNVCSEHGIKCTGYEVRLSWPDDIVAKKRQRPDQSHHRRQSSSKSAHQSPSSTTSSTHSNKRAMPSVISALNLPAEQSFYMQHFLQNIARIALAIDHQGNGYRSLLPMALAEPAVLNAALAVAASHHSRWQHTADDVSRKYLGLACKALRNRFIEPKLRNSPVTLASMLLLVSYEVFSGSSRWKGHYDAIRGWIRGRQGSKDLDSFLMNWVCLIDTQSALNLGTSTMPELDEWMSAAPNILALVKHEYVIVRTSLIGSILSNLLLVMGCCFFFGGLRRPQQYFNETAAQTATSLLAIAVAAVIIPTVFDYTTDNPVKDIAGLSRGTSVILLVVYSAYLLFQLKTHKTVFSEESQKVAAKPWSRNSLDSNAVGRGIALPGALMSEGVSDGNENSAILKQAGDGGEEEEEEEPQLHFFVALGTLVISTVIIALCADYMVDSIDSVTENSSLKKEFVGLILLPIVGNAAEHATAVTVAIKDKMDLAIGVAVGSSMQVALLLFPLLIIIGWGLGLDEMNLSFDLFQVAVMFVAVLLVNYLIADGKSHWLEGFLLICLYSIIGTCAFYYPNKENSSE
ncbi:unnamed protein product [Clonostachys solani]|uniref:Vacuolar calcium ion transporter n=1 Tax=Clonostachys solani TaxID=160281 RepID=A0A9N9ZMV1_9HYPO|nr:unnamed protein product [Clonostachys solani]